MGDDEGVEASLTTRGTGMGGDEGVEDDDVRVKRTVVRPADRAVGLTSRARGRWGEADTGRVEQTWWHAEGGKGARGGGPANSRYKPRSA
jgi:hypothetical protein